MTWQGGLSHDLLDPRARARGPSTHRQVDVTAMLTQDLHHLQEAPLPKHPYINEWGGGQWAPLLK